MPISLPTSSSERLRAAQEPSVLARSALSKSSRRTHSFVIADQRTRRPCSSQCPIPERPDSCGYSTFDTISSMKPETFEQWWSRLVATLHPGFTIFHWSAYRGSTLEGDFKISNINLAFEE